MKTAQPLKVIKDQYDVLAMLRELDFLHKRINGLALTPAQAALKTDYTAGDLGTATAIAAALNATNAAVNQILEKMNLS